MSETRTCIKCGHDMLVQMVQNTEVDVCPNCGGLWLDKDEIRALSEKSDAALGDLRKIIDETEPAVDPSTMETSTPCPACGHKLTMAVLGPIRVEHCPNCNGMFLDKGEMDQAIEMLKLKKDKIATIVAMAKTVFVSGSI